MSSVKDPLCILLVEDHLATRAALTRILSHHGYFVVAAANAEEAKSHANRYRFNVVVSDIGLPDENGFDLMAELHRKWPSLPGIALTAYGAKEDFVRSTEAGFSAHIVKPVDFAQLEKTILALAV